MATIVDITQAVVDELNASGLLGATVAERSYLPRRQLEQLADMAVTVVPKATQVQIAGRSSNQYTHDIDIAVQQRLGSDDAVEIDPLMDLVEQIADHFRLRRLSDGTAAVWVQTQHEPIYAPEHLDQMRVFTAVITLSFRVVR